MQRLLLHCCCGPCATAVVERLQRQYDVTLYWFNPNIQPEEEYQRRLHSMKRLAHELELGLIVDEGGEDQWEREVAAGREDEPEGGTRCDACYLMRLRRAAQVAADKGCAVLAATLSISPHKQVERINAAGRVAVGHSGTDFLGDDFKRDGGFQRSAALSRALGLYRQKHCGCRFSQRE